MAFAEADTAATAAVSSSTVPPIESVGRYWVTMRPMQCLSNPWEQDWVEKHKKGAVYPIREERAVMKQFFLSKGVKTWDIRVTPFSGSGTCSSCDCPRGDSVFVLINAEDAIKMEPYGFKKRIPENALRR